MDVLFICKECGMINSPNMDNGTQNLACESCNTKLTWDHSYPPLNAQDFIRVTQELLISTKQTDKECIQLQHDFLIKGGYNLNFQKIEHYRRLYDKIHKNYPDNDDSHWIRMLDELEDILYYELGPDLGVTLSSTMHLTCKNRFRKPLIIMLATTIEQLFHDFFRELIQWNFSEIDANKILSNYSITGITGKIEYLKNELYLSLKDIMDQHSKGFYERWANIRYIRNRIIHYNNTYISRDEILKTNSLIKESITVFSCLKSRIYKEEIFKK